MNESMVIIIGLFFIIGITVGIIAVVALSALGRTGGADQIEQQSPGA
jgi:hypothetical protein